LTFEDAAPSFFLISPISVEMEIKVLNKLQQIVNEAINKYPTTIEEDRKILHSGTQSHNKRNCILMRMAEKEVLQFYVEFISYCLPLFSMNENVYKLFLIFI
jgi:histone-lysine N-methyltransferase SETD3